jgi:hypothetical protein
MIRYSYRRRQYARRRPGWRILKFHRGHHVDNHPIPASPDRDHENGSPMYGNLPLVHKTQVVSEYGSR